MIIYSGQVRHLEADLAGGVVSCPGCDGPLRPWAHARGRFVRHSPSGPPRWWRPRRGRCGSCGATHVLLPAVLLPRRRDSVEVVGAALGAYRRGEGHRRIAARLGVPASTVRNWLRGFSGQADRLRTLGTVDYHQRDALALPVVPAGSAVGDALEALGLAARAAVLVHGTFDTPWAVINVITARRASQRPNQPEQRALSRPGLVWRA